MREHGSGYVASVLCFLSGDRSHFFYRLRRWRGRKGGRRSFGWRDYRMSSILVARPGPPARTVT
ncbi:hypothetical protein [Streptomyces sioyaensis]|uniref:hypothetical protein n=1 Tax=Streptomyces sioyaensis TaxID=67364 RepID=UPI00378FFF7F